MSNQNQEIEKLKEISKKRREQKDLMVENGDNSHEMLSEGNYTDPQHFIYELLQNAEDEAATAVYFELQKEKLIFSHNSDHLFELGDIVAISNFGDKDSPKRKRENAIGRYGIGFKSVLAITNKPQIQSGFFDVSIKDRYVPIINNENFKSNKTTITLPLKDDSLYDLLSNKFNNITGDEIVFLNNINELTIIVDKEKNVYEKTERNNILTIKKNGNKIGEYLILSKNVNLESKNLTIKIILGVDNNKIIPLHKPLYVFFPTKDETNLPFILHAPFKLATHTREHIDKGYENNNKLLDELASLFVDNLEMLRDKGYIDVNFFNNIFPFRNDKKTNDIYNLFYNKCLDVLITQQCKLLPTNNNDFSNINDCILVGSAKLINLLSKEQMQILFKRQNWVSDKITSNVNIELYNFLRTRMRIPDIALKELLNNIDEDFLTAQTDEWLIAFYKTFCDIKINKEKNEQEVSEIISENELRKKPIVRTTDNKQIVPGNIFLPINNQNISKLFPIVKDTLCKDKTAMQFFLKLGIRKPDNGDEIKKIIAEENNLNNYFEIIFDYWKDEKPQEIIESIKRSNKPFIKRLGFDEYYNANELYYPTADLLKYFEPKPSTKFVDLEYYKNLFVDSKDDLKKFFILLGVNTLPRIISQQIDSKEERLQFIPTYDTIKWTYRYGFIDKIIDGLKEIINENLNFEVSKIIWNYLCRLIFKEGNIEFLKGIFRYFYRKLRNQEFDSSAKKILLSAKWLIRQDGVFVAPSEITIKELNDGYDVESEQAKKLIELLQFKPLEILTKEQKIAQHFKDENEALEAKKALEEKRKREQNANLHGSHISNDGITEQRESDNDNEQATTTEKTIKKIKEKIYQRNEENASDNDIENNEEKGEPQDEDFYTKPAVDFEKKRKYLENKAAEDIDKITQIEELTKAAQTNEKYSFAWFKALLQLELLNNNENSSSNKKDISITFNKIEREQGTNRTLILTQPNRFIPQYIEEFSGVPLNIELKNGETLKIELENFSVKEYILKAKIKSANEIAKIDFSQIAEGTINVKNAEFLLDALVKCFNSLKLKNTDNLKTNLPQNIEFIFGPPGTGKTTYLSEKILIQLMQQSNRVLVLTPTNKAADVLTKRIIEKDKSGMYKNWLVRFGTTADDIIEKELLVKERSFNLDTLENSVVVSTISRFTYDTFDNGFGHKPLYDFKWDYIVVDEASMIHLPSMVFVLYKQQPQKFIIAGDPFQIGPIANVEQWKDENIYTMVELNKPDAFINPQPKPHNFKITPLTTQWRSIEAIGKLFSEFTYNGRLEHYRKNDDIRKLSINSLDIKPLTFIKFPVSKYESIYRSKLLGKSSYHIYSAIFAFEFVKFIADNIKPDANDKKYNIGIISPYRIQANIVNRLVASIKIHDNINIQVGTVHGFQGDECEIIIALFNTPPFISDSPNSFVNRQTILNVSISRAKDYLFVMMPDNNTDRIENLAKINKLEKLSQKDSSNYLQYNSFDIEKTIFNNSKYIESITFSTTHQNVNIYSEVEKVYEVRGDDNAIDIQLRNEKTKTIVSKETKDVEVFKTDTETQEPQKPKIVGKIDLNKIK